LIVSLPVDEPVATPKATVVPRGPNPSKIDAVTVKWVLSRASAFIKRGRRRGPAWSAAELARNLKRSRGVVLSRVQILRLIKQRDPGLSKERCAYWHVPRGPRAALLARKRGRVLRAGTAHADYIVGQHWLSVAYGRIVAGEPELEVLADYGYAPAAALERV
jgi:hypothetical protein